MNQEEIKTSIFLLRPFKKGDELSLVKHINNKKIYQNTLNIPYPYTVKDAQEWINKNIKESKKKNPKMINFAIDINDEVVGSVSFTGVFDEEAEVGYWLSEKYWSRGIISKALKIITELGFKKGFRRIYAYVFTNNKASMKVLENNGFKEEGLLKKHIMKDGKLKDDYLFSKIR